MVTYHIYFYNLPHEVEARLSHIMVEPSSTSGQTVPHVSEDSTTLETFKTVTIAKRWVKIKKGNCHNKDPKDAASF